MQSPPLCEVHQLVTLKDGYSGYSIQHQHSLQYQLGDCN